MTTPAPITQPSSPPNPELLQFAHKADAYLEWAVATLWGGFHRDSDRVAILVQRKSDFEQEQEQLNNWLKSHDELEIALCYSDYRYAALMVKPQFLESSEWKKTWAKLFDRMELASALTQPGNAPMSPVLSNNQKSWQPEAQTIIACIDDAFPFASKRFFDLNGQSRVLRLWDQGQNNSAWYALGDLQTGMPMANFSYGGEVFNQRYLKNSASTANGHRPVLSKWWRKIVGLFSASGAQQPSCG